ncbi:MAG: SMP-30/gluconolactonase/LRE family protein [Erythrobacter sp.]
MRTIWITIGLALAGIACAPAYAQPASPAAQIAQVERFPAEGGLTHAEDGVILPDGRLLVGDWNHGLVTIAPGGTIAPFGDFAAAGFRTRPDPMWNSPNGIAWEPDGRHVLVADITGGHIYRADTVTQQVARIYAHPYGVNAVIRDPSGAIWFTQSTKNAPGAGSEARMFAAADKPMGDGSVWRIAPEEVGKPAPRAEKLVDGLDFANGIAFDEARGRLYVAEIVTSRILSFALDPATGTLSDRRVLARVTTPDNIELAADGMLWVASPFANAIYRIDPDSGAVSTVFNPDPAKSARMVAELERRQAAGEPLLPMLSPELWAPMPGLVTGIILPTDDGPAYVSGLGDALVRIDVSGHLSAAAAATSPLTDFARDYAAAWSSQNPNKVAAFYGENGRLTINGGKPAIGRAAIADAARGFMEAFPDLVVAFDRLGAKDGRHIFHWTLRGTNTGPAGTGARVEVSGAEAWLMGQGGRIADSVGSFDAADYARQLAAPPSATAPDAARYNRTAMILADICNGDASAIMMFHAPDALYYPSACPERAHRGILERGQ